MIEKNYDPDNDNCPEKDTVENLHKSKGNNNNTQIVEEFTDDNATRLSNDKVKDLKKPDAKE